VLAGITRTILAVIVILFIALPFGFVLSYNLEFWLAVLLNAAVFSGVALCMAMLVQSHADQVLLTNFVITPMAFLGGTFFPQERMPLWVQKVLSALPLTHAATAIRTSSFGMQPKLLSHVVLFVLGVLAFVGAFLCVDKAKS
jgi:ABC-2 type transport system permease protein